SGLHGGKDGFVSLMEDAQPKCSRCLQLITADDTLAFEGHQILHLDCRRPRDLSPEERALLFRYCFDHAVAECPTCGQDFRQADLGADLVGHPRTYVRVAAWTSLIVCRSISTTARSCPGRYAGGP